jgi:hypothetical protein
MVAEAIDEFWQWCWGFSGYVFPWFFFFKKVSPSPSNAWLPKPLAGFGSFVQRLGCGAT